MYSILQNLMGFPCYLSSLQNMANGFAGIDDIDNDKLTLFISGISGTSMAILEVINSNSSFYLLCYERMPLSSAGLIKDHSALISRA